MRSYVSQRRIFKLFYLALFLMSVVLFLPVQGVSQNLEFDSEELANTLQNRAREEISNALQSGVEQLQDQALNAVYQQVRQQFEQQFEDEINVSQEAINQFLDANPTINSALQDYREGRSQEVLSSLQGLLDGAREELNQILELNQQAEEEGEEFQSEYVEQLNDLGVRGRWVDRIGEWEAWYQQNAASQVALARQFYEGFEGGAPAGQLTLMFDLIDEYSSNIPVLGRFIALYAQVGREMMNAAIRAGVLIRRVDQGCIGTGTHSGIPNWYNLDDPVNTNFSNNFDGELACPTTIDNIFENVDDPTLLYFWTGSQFLVGASGNGGINAIYQIQEFLRSNGRPAEADNLATLYLVYNLNFDDLRNEASSLMSQVQSNLSRIESLRFDCSIEIFELLLNERAGFTIDYSNFPSESTLIRDQILLNRILDISAPPGQNWDSWENLSENLDNLRYVIQLGTVINESGAVSSAAVNVQTSASIYSSCSELQTDANGQFKVMFMTQPGTVNTVEYTASVGGLTSNSIERFVDANQAYPSDITLQMDDEMVPVSVTISPDDITLEVGETSGFSLFAIFEDGSSTDVTNTGTTWNVGGGSFTAVEPGTFSITGTYLGLSATASIMVEETAGEEGCDDDSEWNEELGRCINLDDAIDEVTEGEGLEMCNEDNLAAQLARLNELVAMSSRLSASVRSTYDNFMKEINDQNSNPCENNVIAVALAGAKQQLSEYQSIVDEATELSTNLILEGAVCPLLDIDLEVTTILNRTSQLGPPLTDIEQSIADMESQLTTYGCDAQEVAEQGNTVAEQTNDPEILRGGGAGAVEICGDGIDNDGDGLIDEGCEQEGNYNVIIVVYDSGNLADDVFGLSVSGQGNLGTTPEGGSRTYPLQLSPGGYTATVTVISAPDNIGTYTIRILEGNVEIASQTGGPGQGSVVTIPFSIGPASQQADPSVVEEMMNFERQVEQFEENF